MPQIIAFIVHGMLEQFLADHRGHQPRTGESVPLAFTVPAARNEAWALLGYDVCDTWATSGLANCGYHADEVAALRPIWAPRLNEHHLFSKLEDAHAFRELTDARVTEHPPFFVYGIWSVS